MCKQALYRRALARVQEDTSTALELAVKDLQHASKVDPVCIRILKSIQGRVESPKGVAGAIKTFSSQCVVLPPYSEVWRVNYATKCVPIRLQADRSFTVVFGP
eukprot:300574-Pyramimonas_sp.AAC.2